MLLMKKVKRLRPRSLARYMAWSALRSSSLALLASRGNTVMPMLAEI
jgi:hypothetical protein